MACLSDLSRSCAVRFVLLICWISRELEHIPKVRRYLGMTFHKRLFISSLQ